MGDGRHATANVGTHLIRASAVVELRIGAGRWVALPSSLAPDRLAGAWMNAGCL